MDRLTKVMQCNDGNKLYDCSNEVIKNVKNFSSRLKLIFEKLAMYEDLEEKGRLLRLPCNIGDKLYYVNTDDIDGNGVIKCNVIGFKHSKSGIEYIIGDYFSKEEGVTYEIGIKPSEIGVNAFYNETEAYAKLDLGVTIGQTLYVISEDDYDIKKAKVISINLCPYYCNDTGFKLSEMRSEGYGYGYYLDVKVKEFDDIYTDLPITVKDFEGGIIFTSKEKAEEKLERLKGEINEERD